MKKTNYLIKFITLLTIWFVFGGSLLFPFSKNNIVSAQDDIYIEITSPAEGSVLDTSTVEFTGSIRANSYPPDQLTFKVFEALEGNGEPVELTKDGQVTITTEGQVGKWSFSKSFSEGNHSLTFEVRDVDGKVAVAARNVTINKPTIEQNVSLQETTTIQAASTVTAETASIENQVIRPYIIDMKIIPPGAADERDYLPAEDMTQVPLGSKLMMVIKEAGTLTFTQPIIVSSNKGDVQSKEDLEGTTVKRNEAGDYMFIFTPSKQLEPSTTYYVYVNPTISNNLGGRIFPRFFKFTTINTNHLNDIHGNYTINTNACAYCHSTHNGENVTLEGGQYGSADTDNFCMVCHDGTNGSPMPDKYDQKNKHSQHSDNNSESCTSCHDPHASWTAENPARIHMDGSGGQFIPLTYKKAGTAKGTREDFTLCLNCHNGTDASNIKQYYDETSTFVAESGHNIKATDGSVLDGQLTCADCHETHGSTNLKSLRAALGNVKLTTDDEKFKSVGTDWNSENERQFCLKCHNNKTELYGKTGTFKAKNNAGEVISGHQPTDVLGCTACHGGASLSSVEAAHAPKKGIYVPNK